MFRNFSIGKKMLVAFGAIVVVVAVFCTVVLNALDHIEAANRESRLSADTLMTTSSVLSQLVEQQNAMRGFVASLDDQFVGKADAAAAEVAALVDRFATQVKGTRHEPVVGELQAAIATFDSEADATFASARAPEKLEQTRSQIATVARLTAIRKIITDYEASEKADAAERDAALADSFAAGRLTLIGGGILSVLIALGMGILLSRSIGTPIVAMTAVMRRLAEGDTAVDVPEKERKDEIGAIAGAVEVFRVNAIEKAQVEAEALANRTQAEKDRMAADADKAAFEEEKALGAQRTAKAVAALANGLAGLARGDLTVSIAEPFEAGSDEIRQQFNQAVGKFAEIMGQLKDTSATLKTATGEILSGANDLAERTTKQAAALEETSAAIEQLTNTVTENAKRAENASTMSQSVSATAEQTGDVMEKSNAAMERISASSSKISNIIGMIDDIAFQTNLLALNASVEAARAGDAGKGFAVVAVEVRRLAQSAAQASSEVKVLIEQSATEVMSGSRLVADATQKLVAMVGSVKDSAGLIQAISAANQEQASALVEVSTAIRQMDEMTQHNAALVEETNAAIEQTENQANDLDQIVAQFVVSGGSSRSPAAQNDLKHSATQTAAAKTPAKAGIKVLQEKVASAAKSYLSRGNAALKEQDWSEF